MFRAWTKFGLFGELVLSLATCIYPWYCTSTTYCTLINQIIQNIIYRDQDHFILLLIFGKVEANILNNLPKNVARLFYNLINYICQI